MSGPRPSFSSPLTIQKNMYGWINASSLMLAPYKSSQGFDSARYQTFGPGFQNWDISIFKNIPLHKESARIQLRVEMFNALNHPNFNAFTYQRDVQCGGQITNLPYCVGRRRRTLRVWRSHHDHGPAQNPTRREDLLLTRYTELSCSVSC